MENAGEQHHKQVTADTISVLLVDDEPGMAKLTADALGQEDDIFTTESVTSAEDCLAELERTQVDCIVSDYDMPGMNGLTLLKRVREVFPDLPFILYTGKGSEEIAVEAIAGGVTDYLQKGTGRDQYTVLANRVKNAVSRYRSEREARRQSRILSLTRRINQALVRASSRDEIESAVCEILGTDAAYDRVSVVRYDAGEGLIRPAATATVDGDSPDPSSVATGSADSDIGIVSLAIRTGEFQVTRDAHQQSESQDADSDSQRGTVSAAIPFGFQDEQYGVILVRSAEPKTFDQSEREMFAEIAEDIGHAIHAVELREELKQHQTAVETVPEGLFILDEEARIELVNEGAASLGGYSPEELEGEPILTLIEDGEFDEEIIDWYLETVRELLSSSTDQEEAFYITEITPKNEVTQLVEIHLTLRPYEDDYRGTVGIIRDITDRHETHQELERKNERLEQFASMVSHDLRNPINAVKGNLALYRETSDDARLDNVEEGLRRIQEITEDLTTLTRQSASAGNPEPLSVSKVASDAWEMTDTRSASLSTEECRVVGNKSQLQALLENLFRNAIGHGGSDVTVRVGPTDDGFYVEDTGAGIPQEERERVFDHGYSTGYTGKGVGLTIVSRIAQAHDWDVTLTESPEGGARFEFHE